MSRIQSNHVASHSTNGHGSGHDGHHVTVKSVAKPTSEAVAEVVGIALTDPIGTNIMQAMNKPYPGHLAVMSHALEMLAVSGLKPARLDPVVLGQAIEERARIASVEAALAPVLRSALDRRVTLDDQVMVGLQKVARAVRNSDDEALQADWAFLTDYLGQYGKMGSRVREANKQAKLAEKVKP